MNSKFMGAVNVKFCDIGECESPVKCFCHDCCKAMCFGCSMIDCRRGNFHRIVLYRERNKIRSEACENQLCRRKGPCLEVCCFTCSKIICDSTIGDHEFHHTMTTSELLVYLHRVKKYLQRFSSKIRDLSKTLTNINQKILAKHGRFRHRNWKWKHDDLAIARYDVLCLTDIKHKKVKYRLLYKHMHDSLSLEQTLSEKIPNVTFISAPNIASHSLPRKKLGPLLICRIKIVPKPFSELKLFGSSNNSVWVHKKGGRLLSRHDICWVCRSRYILDMVPEFVTLARDHVVYVDDSKHTVYKISSRGTQKLVTESDVITAISSSSKDTLLVCVCNMDTGSGEIRKYNIGEEKLLQILASSNEFPFSFCEFFQVFSVTENIDGSVWFVGLLDRIEVKRIVKVRRCFTGRKDSFPVVQILDNLRTICPMEITHNSRGDILILNCNKKEVHIVNKIGHLTWSCSIISGVESFCVDPSDKLWVADSDGEIKAVGCYRLCKPVSRQFLGNDLQKYSKNNVLDTCRRKWFASNVASRKHLKNLHNEKACDFCSFSKTIPIRCVLYVRKPV